MLGNSGRTMEGPTGSGVPLPMTREEAGEKAGQYVWDAFSTLLSSCYGQAARDAWIAEQSRLEQAVQDKAQLLAQKERDWEEQLLSAKREKDALQKRVETLEQRASDGGAAADPVRAALEKVAREIVADRPARCAECPACALLAEIPDRQLACGPPAPVGADTRCELDGGQHSALHSTPHSTPRSTPHGSQDMETGGVPGPGDAGLGSLWVSAEQCKQASEWLKRTYVGVSRELPSAEMDGSQNLESQPFFTWLQVFERSASRIRDVTCFAPGDSADFAALLTQYLATLDTERGGIDATLRAHADWSQSVRQAVQQAFRHLSAQLIVLHNTMQATDPYWMQVVMHLSNAQQDLASLKAGCEGRSAGDAGAVAAAQQRRSEQLAAWRDQVGELRDRNFHFAEAMRRLLHRLLMRTVPVMVPTFDNGRRDLRLGGFKRRHGEDGAGSAQAGADGTNREKTAKAAAEARPRSRQASAAGSPAPGKAQR